MSGDTSSIWRSEFSQLGFDEGPDNCWSLEFEWGHLQVWDWPGRLEWFICGNSLGDAGPKSFDELVTLINILSE